MSPAVPSGDQARIDRYRVMRQDTPCQQTALAGFEGELERDLTDDSATTRTGGPRTVACDPVCPEGSDGVDRALPPRPVPAGAGSTVSIAVRGVTDSE